MEVAKNLGFRGMFIIHIIFKKIFGIVMTNSLLLAGMWAGLGPRIIMIGTLTALQWFIYDGFKVMMRLPRPAPPAMPESLKAKLAENQK